jgi:hypothetical protein
VNQETNGFASPQSEREFQLIGPFIYQRPLQRLFLFWRQLPLVSMPAAALPLRNGFSAIFLVTRPDPTAVRLADAYYLSDVFVGATRLPKSDDLFSLQLLSFL